MYGQTFTTQNNVFGTRVSFDGNPTYKAGGCLLDWATADTADGDVTLDDGSRIRDGQKYFRYGQVITRIAASGKYGRYDPDLTNGRELLTRGACFILDQTILEYSTGTPQISARNDFAHGALDGGSVWLDRIIQSGVATSTLAVGPTKANLLAAFPLLQIVENA